MNKNGLIKLMILVFTAVTVLSAGAFAAEGPEISLCRIVGGRGDGNYPRYFRAGEKVPVEMEWSLGEYQTPCLVSVSVSMTDLDGNLIGDGSYIYDPSFHFQDKYSRTFSLSTPQAKTGEVYSISAEVSMAAGGDTLSTSYKLPYLSVYIDNDPPGRVGQLALADSRTIGSIVYTDSNSNIRFSWTSALDFHSDVAANWVQLTEADKPGDNWVNAGNGNSWVYGGRPLADGSYWFFVRAQDYAGNMGEITSFHFSVEAMPPSVPVLSLMSADPTKDSLQEWTFSSSADAVGFEIGTCGDPGSDPTSWTDTRAKNIAFTNFNQDGRHYVKVRAYNVFHQVSAWSAAGVVVVDRTPPQVPSDTAVEKTPTNNATPTWRWSKVFEDGITYEVSLDNGTPIAVGANDFFTSSSLREGEHSLRVRARDALGNTSSWSTAAKVLIDTTPPKVPVLARLLSSPTNEKNPIWFWEVQEDAAYYEVSLDGAPPLTLRNARTFRAGALSDGSHNLTIRAVDTAGNASNWSKPVEIVIDTTPPGVPGEPASNPYTQETVQTWVWYPVPDEDLAYYELMLDGDSESVISHVTAHFYQTDFGVGEHCLQVRSVDRLGNTSAWSNCGYTVVLPPPEPEQEYPPATEEVETGNAG